MEPFSEYPLEICPEKLRRVAAKDAYVYGYCVKLTNSNKLIHNFYCKIIDFWYNTLMSIPQGIDFYCT